MLIFSAYNLYMSKRSEDKKGRHIYLLNLRLRDWANGDNINLYGSFMIFI
jgi:hypothetical protein